MPESTASPEQEILEIDTKLIGLLNQRQALCVELRELRANRGQPRVDTVHDRAVCQRFRKALGPTGATMGPLLLQLCRAD